jgi:thioredoxin 1
VATLSPNEQSRTPSHSRRIVSGDDHNSRRKEPQMVTQVTTEDFRREVLESDRPVVVDFYADWCLPCRQLGPEIEALSEQWDGRVRFAKLDVDQAPKLAQQYGVLSIPTVLLFEQGKVRARTMGAKPGSQIALKLGLESNEAPALDSGFECAC